MYKLSLRYLKYNKKNTVFTLVSIILAAMLLTLLTSIFSSVWVTMEKMELEKAPYHGNIGFNEKEMSESCDDLEKSINTFENNAVFEETVYERYVHTWWEIPWGMVEHNSSFYYPNIENSKKYSINVYVSVDTGKLSKHNYIKKWFSDRVEEGSLPSRKGEIAITLKEANQKGLNIGDKYIINLDKYKLNKKPETGMSAFQNKHKSANYGEEDFQKIENAEQLEYTICGFVKTESNMEDSFEYCLCDEDLQNLNDNYFKDSLRCQIDFRFKRGVHDENQAVMDAVNESELSGYDENNIYLNWGLLKYELIGNQANIEFLQYIAIAIVIIAVVMIFARMVIDCAFEISAKQRVSHFGILQSVGASRKQVIDIVFFESIILCIVGIPLGILFGFIISRSVFGYILNSFDFEMIARVSEEPFKPYFAFPFFMVLATAVIALVWVMFSAYGTAMRFTKLFPIEAITGGGKSGKVKKPRKHSKSYSKFPALFLADRSMKRNRKRHFITSISITASILLMVVASMILNYVNLQMDSGFEFGIQKLDPNEYKIEEIYKCLKENPDVEYANFISFNYDRSPIKLDEDKFVKEKFRGKTAYDFVPIIDEENFYKIFGKNTNISYDDFKNGECIVGDLQNLSQQKKYTDNIYDRTRLGTYECPIENTGVMNLSFSSPEDENNNKEILASIDLKIGAIEEVKENEYCNPDSLLYNPANDYGVAVIFVPLDIYKQISSITGGEYAVMFDVSMSSQEHYGQLKDSLSELGVEIYAQGGYFIVCLLQIIIILAYVVTYIIFGIAMFNLINTVSTGLLNRENELKILKACGQSNISQNKMLGIESIMYSVNALIYSGIISAFFIWVIRKFMFMSVADLTPEELAIETELINKYIPMFGFVKPLLLFFVISVAVGLATNIIVKKQVGETSKQMF